MTGPDATREPRAAAASPLSRLVGAKLGNFRLERLIGRGRMGAVYLAKDEALLRPTAVKVLAWADEVAGGHDPVQWFLAEARLVARINDPRVVQIYGAARHGDWFYIAMEYVPGRSCEAVLAEAGRLSPAGATDLVGQAAAALAAAHRSGVVHRDVKPANLLLGPGGVAKLGDFGMALGAVGGSAGRDRLRAGTPFYTAPEIWRSGIATPASDLYALGATYFHLLTGHPPYEAADVATVERAHLQAPIPDPAALVPGLPPGCGALVRRLLAKAPGERLASAEEVVRETAALLQALAPGRAAAQSARTAELAPPPVPRARTAGPAAASSQAPNPAAPHASSPAAAPQPPAAAAGGPPPRPPGAPGPAPRAPRTHEDPGGGAMPPLEAIGRIPGVKGAVLGDLGGALLGAVGQVDGEAAAAEASYLGSAILEAGEQLGLGALRRIVLTGQASAGVVLVRGGQVLSARVEPARALAEVEQRIAAIFQAGG